MKTPDQTLFEPANQKTHNIVAWCLLGGMLFLRIPFEMVFRLFSQASWIFMVYEIGTYFLVACLIYWERNRLTDFNIDKLGLIIIIVFKPLRTLVLVFWGIQDPMAYPRWQGFLLWLIAIALVIALWRSKAKLPKFTWASLGWLSIGVLVGIACDFILAYPSSFFFTKSPIIIQHELQEIPYSIINQLGYAAISEEPVFRGFLWGLLIKSGWKNIWIFIVQAALFIVAHLYYFNTYPFSMWVLVPFMAIVFGLIVWRSKTITSSMAAHAVFNGSAMLIAQIVTNFRL